MIMPRYLPPNSYFDDPAEKIDGADRAESESNLAGALASDALNFFAEWTTRGRGRAADRAFRSDIALLGINSRFFHCKRPSAAWVARQHKKSRQRGSELFCQFRNESTSYLQLRDRRLPSHSRIGVSADRIDRADQAESNANLVRGLATAAMMRIAKWITEGDGGSTNRALRTDIVILAIGKHFLPCKRPSAAWVGRQHGISRQRASELWRELAIYIAPYLQFRGQRFLIQRRDQIRQGQEGPWSRRNHGCSPTSTLPQCRHAWHLAGQ